MRQISERLIPILTYSVQIRILILLKRRLAKNWVLDIMVKFVMNVYIIWFKHPFLQIRLRSLKCRFFTIWIAFSILFTNIIVFDILLMTFPLSIKKSRFLNLVLYFKLTIYIRFDHSCDYLYICNGRKSFSETQMYSRMFGVIVANNRHIKMVGNTSFKYPNIWYSFRKFC